MTADTETIREALDMLPEHSERWCLANAAALAALGRVEERERALTEELQDERLAHHCLRWQLGLDTHEGEKPQPLADSIVNLTKMIEQARAALAGSVTGEQEEETE